MGVLADRLDDLIVRMKESDEKLNQVTDQFLSDCNTHISQINNLTESDDCDVIESSIAILREHGYTIIAPTK